MNKSNKNGLWTIIREIFPKNSSNIPNYIKIDGNYPDIPNQASEMINNYFISSIQKIIDKSVCEPDFTNLACYINNKVPLDSYFSVPEISKDQVLSMLKALNIKKSTGLDLLGPRILRISAECICKPLTKIINYCITNGVFPKRWKEAKIIPMQKTGPIDDISCYRPISILPILSKIIEKHIFISFYEYLDRYSLISRNQSGFRRSHSCETSLLEMVQNWYDNVNKGKIIGTVFIDLRKAFDLVDHKLLLLKLRIYKVSENSLSLFNSYLTDRSQKVSYNQIMSSFVKVLSGVPQGSILGPLLFLVFVNDMFLTVRNSDINQLSI